MTEQKGLSLIELMIALLIGSLLTIAATQLFLVNRQTDNLQQGIASIQDNGRFAFDFISRNLMEAGLSTDEPIVPFSLDGSEYNSANPTAAEITDGTRYDSIVLPVAGGKDCLGNALTGYKRLHVLADGNGKRLVCTSYEYRVTTDDTGTETGSWHSDDSGSLIDNVEAFQVLYGIDFDGLKDAGYGIADIYTNASRLKAMADQLNSGKARIVSVRFAVLLASDEKVVLDPQYAPAAIQVLDQVYQQGEDATTQVDFSDGRLYRMYGSTVALRNLVSGI